MPAWSRDRMAGQPDRDDDGADAGRRAQQAEPPGAELEDVARIDRQQRRRAGRAARRKGRARSRRARSSRARYSGSRQTASSSVGLSVSVRCAGLGIGKHQQPAADHQAARRRRRRLRRRDAVEQAAGDRADDGGGLPGRANSRRPRWRSPRPARDWRPATAGGRAEEGAGDAEQRRARRRSGR